MSKYFIQNLLKSLYKKNNEIKILNNELNELKEIATSITVSNTEIKSNKANNKVCDNVSSIIEMEEELKLKIEEYNHLRKKVKKVINSLNNENEKLLLSYRYLNFMRWEHIAVKMNYGYNYVFEIHNKAIKKLIEIV